MRMIFAKSQEKVNVNSMYQKPRDKSLSMLFFEVGIFLLPYDAMHVMPSTYRPISIYFFLLSVFLLPTQKRYRIRGKYYFALSIFFIYSVFDTLLQTWAIRGEFGTTVDYVSTIVLGLITYCAVTENLLIIKEERGGAYTLSWIVSRIAVAYYVPLAIGLVEAFSLMGLLPYAVKGFLLEVFGGNHGTRLCVTSLEAGWVAIHLLIAFLAYTYMYKSSGKNLYAIPAFVAVALFVYTQSLNGYLVLLISLAVFAMCLAYKMKNGLVLIKYMGFATLALLIGYGVLLYFFTEISPSTYFANRFIYFTNFDNLIRTDESSFTRFMFPVIGIRIFVSNLIFGVGGGGFAADLPYYIHAYYPWALNFQEIAGHLSGATTASAFCLYTRVLAEFGLLGGIPFYIFFAKCTKNVMNVDVSKPGAYALMLLLLVPLVMALQHSSFAYVPFWLTLGICSSALHETSSKA